MRRWHVAVCPECDQIARQPHTHGSPPNLRTSQLQTVEVMPVVEHAAALAQHEAKIAELNVQLGCSEQDKACERNVTHELRGQLAEAEAAVAQEREKNAELREALRYLADEDSWTSGAKLGKLLMLFRLAPWRLARATLARLGDET